jgi:hypothetical protein
MSAVVYLKQTSITSLLRHWVSLAVSPEALTWLDNKREQIKGGELRGRVFYCFQCRIPLYR